MIKEMKFTDLAPVLRTISYLSRLLNDSIRYGNVNPKVDIALLRDCGPWETLPGKAKDAFAVYVIKHLIDIDYFHGG